MILASIQLVLIAYIIFYELKKKSPSFFLWASLFVFFGIMHWLTLLLGNSKYTYETLDKCSIFVIIFCILYLITREFICSISRSQGTIKIINESNIRDIRIQNISIKLIIGTVGIYVLVILFTAGGFSSINHSVNYTVMSQHTIINLLCAYIYIAISSVLLSLIVEKRKKDTIIVVICMVLYTMFSTSRINIIGVFVAIIGFVVLKNNRINFKQLLSVAVLGVLTIYATYLIRTFRYYYSFSDIGNISITELNRLLTLFLINDDGDLGLRNVFYFLVSKNNQFPDLTTGQGYLRLLLFAIPSRFLNGLKPEDICITLGRIWMPSFKATNGVNYTVTPTLFGDAYANFGMWGFLLGIFWAVIVCAGDHFVHKRKNTIRYMYYMCEAVLYVIIGRGSVYNSFMHFFFAIILFTIIDYYTKHFRIVI